MMAVLSGAIIIILICITLTLSNVEHHFMCLLAICICSLEKLDPVS